jgi:hypothetical protein
MAALAGDHDTHGWFRRRPLKHAYAVMVQSLSDNLQIRPRRDIEEILWGD